MRRPIVRFYRSLQLAADERQLIQPGFNLLNGVPFAACVVIVSSGQFMALLDKLCGMIVVQSLRTPPYCVQKFLNAVCTNPTDEVTKSLANLFS